MEQSQEACEPQAENDIRRTEVEPRSRSWTTLAGVGLVVLAALQPLRWGKILGRICGTGLVGAGLWTGTRRQKWWTAAALAGVLVFNFFWAFPRELFAYDVSSVPLAAIAEVEALVVPGGERVTVHPKGDRYGGSFNVCFYDQGCIVGAAHGADFPEPPWDLCTDCFPSNLTDGVPTFTANTPFGVVISGAKCPEPGRQALPIAGPDDIQIGQKATMLASGLGNADLEVMGYFMAKEDQFLVVRMPKNGPRMGKGLSGTPLVQNGKIIGFLAASPMWDISGTIGLARPAADVYAATREYR
jgi:hypothetical protein